MRALIVFAGGIVGGVVGYLEGREALAQFSAKIGHKISSDNGGMLVFSLCVWVGSQV